MNTLNHANGLFAMKVKRFAKNATRTGSVNSRHQLEASGCSVNAPVSSQMPSRIFASHEQRFGGVQSLYQFHQKHKYMITPLKHLIPSFLVAVVIIFVCTGCNTAHGFGKDMEKAGEKIQDGTK